MTAIVSFDGPLLAEDRRSGLEAYLTDGRRIAVFDRLDSRVYDYDTFDEFAEDCGDAPRFVKAVARCLNHKPPADQPSPDTQDISVGGASTPTTSHLSADTHNGHAGGGNLTSAPEYIDGRLVLVSRELAVLAERVHALEEFRKACANQHQTLTDTKMHKDGEYRGQHLPADNPVAILSATIVETIQKTENDLISLLEKEIKKSPLGPWIKSRNGLGEKTIARLLAAIGDPYWNDLHGRPRTVSELWAFCGYRPGQRLRKGQQAGYSPEAKMRAHIILSTIKQMIRKPCHTVYREPEKRQGYIRAVHVEGVCACSPYRVMYDEARDKYRDTVHPETGELRTDGHLDNMALRLVKKHILKELWREARRLHEESN